MVIAVCSFAVALWPDRCTVGTGIGSAGPTPRRSTAAEAWVAAELDWDNPTRLAPELTAEFGRLVVEAASPIDDVRGSAAYRRHSLAVVAQRSLGWVWRDYVRTMEKAV
jgi:CO/xanthine dehydrogenase FAD-binding subunit